MHGETEKAIKNMVDSLPREMVSFCQIATIIGKSSEYVRVRLRTHPNVRKVGRGYEVPRATAARFIQELYDHD
jgi:hypothetical protein